MAVPKKRHSNSRSGKRRSQQGIVKGVLNAMRSATACPICGETVLRHRTCRCKFKVKV